MLANPRIPWQIPIGPYVRIAIATFFVGAIAFFALFGDFGAAPVQVSPRTEVTIAVPHLEADILAKARDGNRHDRLILESEPFEHLLEKAINVSPTVAVALGMPETPPSIDEIREKRDEMRGRWFWFKGRLEELSGPREGHPIKGFSIYEARVEVPGGEQVLAAFSLPPPKELKKGEFVRIEGFFLELRDTTWPVELSEAPMLVGREIRRDYADWGPVTEFDPSLLEGIDDENILPGAKIWDEIDDDQDVPLWHLAAYARDTANRETPEQWRKHPVLNLEIHDDLIGGKVARGTPMRVLGTLVKIRDIVAEPNPAGITHWTVAYLQCMDYASYVVPIWIPRRIRDIPLRTDLEVKCYFYRWFAYESIENMRYKVPLFVAAGLDRFELHADETMTTIGLILVSSLVLLLFLVAIGQWRTKRHAAAHARDMDRRRRRNRERAAAASKS